MPLNTWELQVGRVLSVVLRPGVWASNRGPQLAAVKSGCWTLAQSSSQALIMFSWLGQDSNQGFPPARSSASLAAPALREPGCLSACPTALEWLIQDLLHSADVLEGFGISLAMTQRPCNGC